MAKQLSEQEQKQRDDRQKIAGLSKLGQFRFARWMNRRQHEWKVSASVWAILAALAAAIAAKKVIINPLLLAPLLAAVVALHGWYWVRANWQRNQSDIRAAFRYYDQVHLIVTGRARDDIPPERRSFLGDEICAFQVGATLLLSCAAFIASLA
jgi:hypothetical protein